VAPVRKRLAVVAAAVAVLAAVLLFAVRSRSPPASAPGAEGAAASAARAPPPSPPAARALPAPGYPIAVSPPQLAPPDVLPPTFEGRVVSRTAGAGVAGAELTFSRGGAAASVRAGPDGSFRFEPPAEGRWLLAAVTARGFLPFAPEWGHSPVQLEARPGVHVRGLEIHLSPADELDGRVVHADGRPAAGAEVRLVGTGGEAALVPLADRFTAGSAGEFRFSAPRGAVLEARLPGFAPGVAAVDLAATLERRVTLTLGPPEQARSEAAVISGRVVASGSGAPVPGALVVAERPGVDRLVVRAQAAAGGDGAFELRGLEPGQYRVTARAEGRAPGSVRRIAAGTADVVVELGDGGRLRGCVRDAASGAPVAPFTVLVFERRSALSRALQRSRSFVDASGCYALDDLAPGPAAVVISAPGFAPSRELAVELAAAGEAVADAALERGARLSGTVVSADTGAPLAGALLSVEGSLSDAASTFPVLAAAGTDAAGRFVLEGLPARFSVLAAAAGHHGRVVSMSAGAPGADAGPVELALRPVDPGEEPRVELAGIGVGVAPRGEALRVTFVSPRGGGAEAGLARGDLILQVDGIRVVELGFQGTVDAIRGPEGTSVLLTVRREEETFELRVSRRVVRG
jgi:hypothetical protein